MKLTRAEIDAAVKDPEWQKFREGLRGLSLEVRLRKLIEWLKHRNYERVAIIQVINYINALKRAGMIKNNPPNCPEEQLPPCNVLACGICGIQMNSTLLGGLANVYVQSSSGALGEIRGLSDG
ncbi:MAG: hypothetical protein QXT73_02285 [Candidatus Methanomethylicaceae archaeon]